MKLLKPVVLAAAALSLGLVVLPTSARAQSPNPVTTALQQYLQRFSRNMTSAAEKMPADKYSFKPTVGSRTFGGLVLHIANANRFSCHNLTGAPAAPGSKLTETAPKAELVQSLKESFDYCSKALAHFSDSKLGEQVPSFGGRKITVAASILELSEDWADHYSAEAAYLRQNGLLPPTAHRGRP